MNKKVDSHSNCCEYCCSMIERFTYPSSLSDIYSPDEIENLHWAGGPDTHGIVYEGFGECPCQILTAGADEVWYEDEQ